MHISVADFSPYPSGRNDNDGPHNGTRFREEILLPAVLKAVVANGKVIVHLANVMSFGSSFLEEAFGGMIRGGRVKKADLARVLEVDEGPLENQRYKAAIKRYIERA